MSNSPGLTVDDTWDDAKAALDEVNKAAPEEPIATDETTTTDNSKSDPIIDKNRDELGRFAKSDDKPEKIDKAIKAPIKEIKPETPATEIKSDATSEVKTQSAGEQIAGNPPPGWSVKSKSEWEKLPPHIRADVLKREQEVNNGFAEYKGMGELKPYMEMARSQGTTLKAALDRYLGIENGLRQNPIQGLLHIAGNVGITPQRLAMELAPLLGQSNSQAQSGAQPSEQPQAFDHSFLQQHLNPLVQEVNQIKSLFQQQQEANKARELSSINMAVERFEADPAHRYYANVQDTMLSLLERGVVQRTGDYGKDLQTAYDMACRMDPEISEILVNEKLAKSEASRKQQEKEAAEKAKLASRSLTGSPNTGNIKDEGVGGDSIEDDVRRAIRAHAA